MRKLFAMSTTTLILLTGCGTTPTNSDISENEFNANEGIIIDRQSNLDKIGLPETLTPEEQRLKEIMDKIPNEREEVSTKRDDLEREKEQSNLSWFLNGGLFGKADDTNEDEIEKIKNKYKESVGSDTEDKTTKKESNKDNQTTNKTNDSKTKTEPKNQDTQTVKKTTSKNPIPNGYENLPEFNGSENDVNIITQELDRFVNQFSVRGEPTDIQELIVHASNQSFNRLLIDSVEYYKREFDNNEHTYVFSIKYNTTGEQYNELIKFAKNFKSKQDNLTNDKLLILEHVNNEIVNLGDYNEKEANIYSPFSLYKYGYGVCQAYTSLAKIMLDELNFKNGIVVGSLDGVPHTWNIIEVDGELKHFDFTNNDTSSSLKYFNVTDEEIRKTHLIENIYMD